MDHKSLHSLGCASILPYFSYCIEVWGNIYKSTLHSLKKDQYKVSYLDHTKNLFLRSKELKPNDLEEYYTAQITFTACAKVFHQKNKNNFRG